VISGSATEIFTEWGPEAKWLKARNGKPVHFLEGVSLRPAREHFTWRRATVFNRKPNIPFRYQLGCSKNSTRSLSRVGKKDHSDSVFERIFYPSIIAFLPFAALIALLWYGQKKRQASTKNPFTSYLLRPPGESLRIRLEELEEKFNDHMLTLFICSIMIGIGAWIFFENLVGGVAVILMGVTVFAYFSKALVKNLDSRRNHYLGFLGERAVGEELNQLLAHGWSVFHDVQFSENPSAKPFNVDHVVVGTGGIFAIETKTRRKQVMKSQAGPHNEVIFDGEVLHYPWGPESYGLQDARRRSEHLSKWLSTMLKTPCAVAPILALPGWYVKRIAPSDLCVVSGREICSVFRNEHTKNVVDRKTLYAISALLDQKCRDVGIN